MLSECRACGHWSAAPPCPTCGWETLHAVTSTGVAPAPIRALFELVLSHEGDLRLSGLQCHRLPWLATDDSLRQRLQACLSATPEDDDAAGWDGLIDALHAVVHDVVVGLMPPPLPAGLLVSACARVGVHAQGRDLRGVTGPRLQAIDFSEQMARLGAAVRPESVAVDLHRLRLSIDRERWCGEVGITPDVDLLVLHTALVERSAAPTGENEPDTLVDDASHIFCPAGHRTSLSLPHPPAVVLHRIAEDAAGDEEPDVGLELRIRGLDTPLRTPLPSDALRDLPGPAEVAHLYLDIGRHTGRLVLCQGPSPDQWSRRLAPTAELLAALGQPLPAESTAAPAEDASWLEAALPALASWASRRHHCFLGDVVATLPHAHDTPPPEAPAAGVSGDVLGEVGHIAEHRALAAHLAPAVVAAGSAAATDERRRPARATAIAKAQNYNKLYKRQRELAAVQYDMSSGVGRMLSGLTGDPRLKPMRLAPVPEPFPDVPPWLTEMVSPTSRLDRVAAIDLGARSVELALLDKGVPDDDAGASWCGPGGDRVSEVAGLWDGRATAGAIAATQVKARLGDAGPEDTRRQSLAAATAEVFGTLFATLATQLAARWEEEPILVVLLGEATASPAARSALAQALESAAIDAVLVDAGKLGEALAHWHETGIESARVPSMARAMVWAEAADRPVARDPFGVVDGLLQLRGVEEHG